MTPTRLHLLRTTTGLAACAALLGLSACAGMSEQTRDTTIGAGVGSVITGSIAGAAVGAVIGGVIGHENDEKDKKKK
jgi:osmotically inducible lipoprotein OsmB